MRHINQVKKLFEDDKFDEAESALDNILHLGPSNVEALKIKAMIHNGSGRYEDESRVWQKILTIDSEDPEAIDYIERRMEEDRENFHYVDVLNDGGRCFRAESRAFAKICMLGFMGCISFLLAMNTFPRHGIEETWVIVSTFCVLVLAPFLALVWVYLFCIKAVNVSSKGIEIVTRLETYRYDWQDLDRIALIHTLNPFDADLRLLIVPTDIEKKSIAIDLNEETSAMKARSYFIKELKYRFERITYESPRDEELEKLQPLSF